MQNYRVVHLGLGRRGKNYLRPFLESPRFDLVGVCELNQETLDACGTEFSLSKEILSTDVEGLLARTRPDIFSFVTGPSIRLSLVEKAINAGVKGIIFEKPAANTLAELRAIHARCEAAGVRAIVCHQHKYAPQYQRIAEYLRSGRAGKIYEINVYCTIRQTILQVVTHGLDLLLWLNQYEPAVWVAGHASGGEPADALFQGARYVVGRAQFANGVTSTIESGVGGALFRSGEAANDITVTVLAEKGTAFANGSGVWKIQDDEAGVTSGQDGSILKIMGYDLQMPFLADYVEWLDGGREHTSCVRNALAGQEILEALYKSSEEQARVALPLPANDPGDRATHYARFAEATIAG